MVTLKSRLEHLEAVTPTRAINRCLVVHHSNCQQDRETAVAAYVAEYGCEPEDFIDIIVVSPDTKQSLCGCPLANTH